MKVSQQASRASLPGMIRCGLIALCLSASSVAAGEEAMPCAVSSDTNLPFFGDLHIHTRYSFDSFLSNLTRKTIPMAPTNTLKDKSLPCLTRMAIKRLPHRSTDPSILPR